MLDVSRIATGKMRLDQEASDLAALIEDTVAVVRPAAEARRMPLRLTLDRTLPKHFIDPTRMQQVLWNLLSNAIKFSPDGAPVDVVLRREESQAVIEVIDRGPGIAAELRPHLFERFRQGDSSSSRVYGGLGIGLSLAKELVELHGGRIDVESEEGRGSKFTVRLPSPAPKPSGAAEALLSGVRVLYVDDRDDARLVIATMLRQYGANVLQAASVDDALGLIARERPHVVLTDIAMPHRDGYDLLASIRAEHEWSNLPVLALTAERRNGDEARATAAGFAGFLRKPIEPRELARAVAEAVPASR